MYMGWVKGSRGKKMHEQWVEGSLGQEQHEQYVEGSQGKEMHVEVEGTLWQEMHVRVEGELSSCLVVQYLLVLLDLPHWYLPREVRQLYGEDDPLP